MPPIVTTAEIGRPATELSALDGSRDASQAAARSSNAVQSKSYTNRRPPGRRSADTAEVTALRSAWWHRCPDSGYWRRGRDARCEREVGARAVQTHDEEAASAQSRAPHGEPSHATADLGCSAWVPAKEPR
jgi:hypothetical protein